MNLDYVDRPTSSYVHADTTTGAHEAAQVELTDHAFVLCLNNPTMDTVDVRIDVWSAQHDHFTETIPLGAGYHVCCKIADVPGEVAHYQVDAQHGGTVSYEVYSNL